MKHTLKRRLLTTLLATSLLTATATPAFAQEYQGPQFGTSSTTTWLGITVTTGAIVMIVIYLLKPSDGAALLQEYLQENQHAVAQDMAASSASLRTIKTPSPRCCATSTPCSRRCTPASKSPSRKLASSSPSSPTR